MFGWLTRWRRARLRARNQAAFDEAVRKLVVAFRDTSNHGHIPVHVPKGFTFKEVCNEAMAQIRGKQVHDQEHG